VLKSTKIEIAVYGQSMLTNSNLLTRLNRKFNVFPCTSLNQVRQILESASIKILLIEIGSNGKELKILKEIHSSNPGVRVIALGDEEPKEHLIKAYKYGSKDFFKIPVNTALLIERVESIVKRNTQQLITI
jgi:DNA-binding NtrC family response regulator